MSHCSAVRPVAAAEVLPHAARCSRAPRRPAPTPPRTCPARARTPHRHRPVQDPPHRRFWTDRACRSTPARPRSPPSRVASASTSASAPSPVHRRRDAAAGEPRRAGAAPRTAACAGCRRSAGRTRRAAAAAASPAPRTGRSTPSRPGSRSVASALFMPRSTNGAANTESLTRWKCVGVTPHSVHRISGSGLPVAFGERAGQRPHVQRRVAVGVRGDEVDRHVVRRQYSSSAPTQPAAAEDGPPTADPLRRRSSPRGPRTRRAGGSRPGCRSRTPRGWPRSRPRTPRWRPRRRRSARAGARSGRGRGRPSAPSPSARTPCARYSKTV